MRKSQKGLKFRNKKKTRTRKNKRQKNYLLKGGWEETDDDYIAYRPGFIEHNPQVDIFAENIKEGLLLNINKQFQQFQPFHEVFSSLDEAIARITFLASNESLPPGVFIDDFDYTRPKLSVLPKGTIFYRRQTINPFVANGYPIWLDYTGTMSREPFSFLKDINDEYTQEYLDSTISYFGEFLMKFMINRNLLILHFPSYVKALSESWVRYICLYLRSNYCVDGYTLDFLSFNYNLTYKKLKSLKGGYRELCIINNKNVSLREVEISPRQIDETSGCIGETCSFFKFSGGTRYKKSKKVKNKNNTYRLE